ncbi:hypothetical protein [Roseovarius sp. MBR-6]|jgi:UDP-3-O-[3-hydroxymyristoyl] glucosamine N-acyltransferase|uniref:hypothetical protein n=1 Tax=Roseovarius sp. MBR-6 TaxID=3156459 RepID=UPI00339A12CF
MFTGNTINLGSVIDELNSQLIRDVDFSYIGKIPSNLNRRVVPALKPEHVKSALAYSDIAGIITRPENASLVPKNMGLLVAEDPVTTSLHIHERLCDIDGFLWKSFDTEIHPTAQIHPSAVIAESDVRIGPGAVVGPFSLILERSILEEGAHVGVGVVVGLDAFEIFEGANPRRILKQAGGVWLERGATVLAKCTLVRATFGGFTLLQENAMVDVLIHIAHDVILGKNSTVVACAEISGRCELGEGSYIGPNACLTNGIKIGKNSKVSLGSVVTRDVADDTVVTGNFAVPHRKWLHFIKSLAADEIDE